MIRLVFAILAGMAFSVGAASSQDSSRPGLYRDRDGSCHASGEERPEGSVRITAFKMQSARGTCEFTSTTRVSRMSAELRDASCQPSGGDHPFNTRFFIHHDPRGVTVVSKEWGTWALARCPD